MKKTKQPVLELNTTEDYIEHFKNTLEHQGCSAKTVNIYARSVILFYSLYGELSIDNLKNYRTYLINSFQTSTVNTRICGINRFLDCMYVWGQLPDSLILSSETPIQNLILLSEFRDGRKDKKEHNGGDVEPVFTRANSNGIYKLLPVKEQRKSYMDNIISQRDYERLKRRLKQDGNLYWYFVVRFLGATGARISELLQIKIEDLSVGYLDLYTKGGKIRRLYFPRILCEEAIPYYHSQGIQSGFIFLNRQGNLISSRAIEMQLKTLAKRYHINPDTVYPHSFRHRYAKNFLKKFNDITLLADLMGHDSVETTRIYLTRSSQEQKELLDRIITW
ncbi:MAG: tyrosine-type recombinase/integrase [Clostridium sp.]|nr:tyrosine-type recombinase/integrase [Clostridium sp.]MDY5483979.1 tyrosine-type recombinase/integrase [Clostridium sp.]